MHLLLFANAELPGTGEHVVNLMVKIHLLQIFPFVLIEPNAVAVAATIEIEIETAPNPCFGHQT